MSKKRKEDGHKRRKAQSGAMQCCCECWNNPCCSNLEVNAGENFGVGQHMLPNLTHARAWAYVYPNLRYKKEAISQIDA